MHQLFSPLCRGPLMCRRSIPVDCGRIIPLRGQIQPRNHTRHHRCTGHIFRRLVEITVQRHFTGIRISVHQFHTVLDTVHQVTDLLIRQMHPFIRLICDHHKMYADAYQQHGLQCLKQMLLYILRFAPLFKTARVLFRILPKDDRHQPDQDHTVAHDDRDIGYFFRDKTVNMRNER